MSLNHISTRIRKLRQERNLTQEYIAYNLGIDQTTYSRIENGFADITVRRLERIALLLDVDPASFFKDNVIPLQPIYTALKEENSEVQDDLQKMRVLLSKLCAEVNEMKAMIAAGSKKNPAS